MGLRALGSELPLPLRRGHWQDLLRLLSLWLVLDCDEVEFAHYLVLCKLIRAVGVPLHSLLLLLPAEGLSFYGLRLRHSGAATFFRGVVDFDGVVEVAPPLAF